jgi:peroxiredoxin
MRLSRLTRAATIFVATGLCAVAAPAQAATTVIHQGVATSVAKTLPDANDLWVTPEDFTKVNGFILKPEGLCRDEICIPLRQSENSDMYMQRQGQKWLSLTQFARNGQQAFVHDDATDTWSFGEYPHARDNFLQSAMAPDFELKDRKGKTVKLSDFRGKKVMLVTWASWCGCRLDVPAWQPIYEELKTKNFEIISVAEDTAGEAAAGPILDAAKPTYTTLIDTKHVISQLYNFVNVPSAAWIDEQGRIVRINEGTYAKSHKLSPQMTIGTDAYTPALRDWVAKGEKSKYVWTSQKVAEKIRKKSSDEAKAEAVFQLGTYFFDRNDRARADQYWNQAQALFPESWNMHRQDWSITDPSNAGTNWRTKRQRMESEGVVYYEDLEL